jgi:hypothetical protein
LQRQWLLPIIITEKQIEEIYEENKILASEDSGLNQDRVVHFAIEWTIDDVSDIVAKYLRNKLKNS